MINGYNVVLFCSSEDLKRVDYEKMRSGSGSAAPLTNLEIFRIEDPMDSRLLARILENAPNLKSHSVTGFQVLFNIGIRHYMPKLSSIPL